MPDTLSSKVSNASHAGLAPAGKKALLSCAKGKAACSHSRLE